MTKNQKGTKPVLDQFRPYFDDDDPNFDLNIAILENDHRKFLDLLRSKVDPLAIRMGRKRMSILHAAATLEDVSILALLLSKVRQSFEVNPRDKEGQTPLHYAVIEKRDRIVDWLLFAGADPSILDKRSIIAENLDKGHQLKDLFEEHRIIVPSVMKHVIGAWEVTFPDTGCELVIREDQGPQQILPPVLMVRRLTKQSNRMETNQFEDTTYEFDEICFEMYEFRCVSPCALSCYLSLKGRTFNPDKETLVLKVKDDDGSIRDTDKMEVDTTKMQASCEVQLFERCKFAIVSRTRRQVSIFQVGKEAASITVEAVPGLKLDIPENAFDSQQEIAIKVEDVPHKIPETKEYFTSEVWDFIKDKESQDNKEQKTISRRLDELIRKGENEEMGNAYFPIKNLSSFISLKSSGQQKLQKAIDINIPLTILNRENTVVNLKRAFTVVASTDKPPKQPENDPVTCDADNEAWILEEDVQISQDLTAVSGKMNEDSTVVSAEVLRTASKWEIIQAVSILYKFMKKEEISIYAMARPFSVDRVQVVVCFVSAALFKDAIKRWKSDGYRILMQPMAAYVFKRQVFLLHAQSELEFDCEADTELEYQVGGRENYASFLFKLSSEEKLDCKVKVERKNPEKDEHAHVCNLHLDLSLEMHNLKVRQLDKKRRKKATLPIPNVQPKKSDTCDKILSYLAGILKLNNVRIYCLTLGIMDEDIEIIRKEHPSPKEMKLKMLTVVKSTYTSDSDFLLNLRRVLQFGKEFSALEWIDKNFDLKTLRKK